MKIFSLNTHSLVDSNAEQSISTLASFIEVERPDVICLQEVNQPREAPLADTTRRSPLPAKADDVFFVPYREGNFLLLLSDMLSSKGINYNTCWLPIKIGYGRYDEGLALLSFYPLSNIRGHLISKTNRYENFRRRMCLIAGIDALGITVCNTHTSRFDDDDEPFIYQWEQIKSFCHGDRHIIAGDFNCPADQKRGGYEKILDDGYFDLYRLARSRIGYATVKGEIDGWRDGKRYDGMRIDFMFSNRPFPNHRIEFRTVLTGECLPTVSDHFGIYAKISKTKENAL